MKKKMCVLIQQLEPPPGLSELARARGAPLRGGTETQLFGPQRGKGGAG